METYSQLSRDYESYFSIIFAISLCIYIGITAAVASTGKRKGLSYWPVFAFSFFATPIAGLLYIIANLQQSDYSYTYAGTVAVKEEMIEKEEQAINEEQNASQELAEPKSYEPSLAVKKGKWDVF